MKKLSLLLVPTTLTLILAGCGKPPATSATSNLKNISPSQGFNQPGPGATPAPAAPGTQPAAPGNTPGNPPGAPGTLPVSPANPPTHGGPQAPGAPGNPAAPSAPANPSLKYPAAIVFEAGLGNASDPSAASLKAKWRLYLCLQATDNSSQGKVHVDLVKLRSPIFQRWTESTGAHRLLRVEKLDELTLTYDYQSRFEGAAENAADSQTTFFTSTSEQRWAPVSHLRHYHPPAHQASTDDLSLFNWSIQENSQATPRSYTYQEQDGSTHYLAGHLELAAQSGALGIEECERSAEAQFFVIGLDGPNPMNVTSP